MKRHRFVIALLIVALLVSGVANLLLYHKGRHFYQQLHGVRLDPLGLGHYAVGAALEPVPQPGQRRVVLVGDSRIEDWPAPPGMDRVQFVNRGISNQTSAQVLARFEEHVALLNPEVIVVQAGINDLKAIPLFPEQRASIVANCQANLERIVAQGLELGATVVLTTIFPIGPVPPERRLFWSGDVAGSVEEINSFLRSLEGDRVVVLDSAVVLADEKGQLRREYRQDFLHLNPAGYEALNEELVPILGAVGP